MPPEAPSQRLQRPARPARRHPWAAAAPPHLNSAVALSTMSTAKRESAIMLAACMSSCCWCSVLCARAYATLSSTSCAFRP